MLNHICDFKAFHRVGSSSHSKVAVFIDRLYSGIRSLPTVHTAMELIPYTLPSAWPLFMIQLDLG